MLERNIGQTGIDRSIGFLFIGLAITGFMLLSVLGMGRVQRNAEETSNLRSTRNNVNQVQIDFGE